jgi:hypothetical protein
MTNSWSCGFCIQTIDGALSSGPRRGLRVRKEEGEKISPARDRVVVAQTEGDTVINRQFSAARLRDQVRASRAATTLGSWRATKPTTMGIVQCDEPDGPF